MRIIFKLLIFAVAMLAFGGLRAQTVIGTGAVNQLTYQKGGYGADSVMGLPVRDTFCNNFPAFRCAGRMTVQPGTFNVYVNTGTYWKQVGALGIPNLQQVTDVGATTTHDITVGGLTANGDVSVNQTIFTEDIDVNGEIIYQSPASGEGNILIKNGSNVVKVSSISTSDLDSLRGVGYNVIFISEIPNIHQNANLHDYRVGDNDNSLIQPYLNLATAEHPLFIVQDGASKIDSALKVKPNTYFLTIPGGGFILDSGARDFMLTNYTLNANSPTPDSNIVIDGGFWNGNGLLQLDPVTGFATREDTGQTTIFAFSGVKNLKMKNVTQYNSTTWGTAFIGVSNCLVSDFWYQAGLDTCRFSFVGEFEQGKIRMVQDGLDLRGGCHDFVIERARGNSTDDFIALNNIHYIWPVDSKFLNYDPIYNITMRDIFLDNSTYGIGIYSMALIDNVKIYNLYGRTQFNRALVAGSNSGLAGSQVGYAGGNVGSLFVDGVNVVKGDSLINFPNPQSVLTQKIDFDGNIKCATIKNYINPNEYGYAIKQEALGWPIEQLNIENYYEVDTANETTVVPRMLINGIVNQMNVKNVNWVRRAGTNQKGVFAVVGQAYKHTFDGMYFYNIDTPISYNGGTGHIVVNNVRMDSCDINSGIFNAPQGTPSYTLSMDNINPTISRAIVGSGATTIINAGGYASSEYGTKNIYDARNTTLRGWQIKPSAGTADLVADDALGTYSIGILNNARNSRYGGMHFIFVTGGALFSQRFGQSPTVYGLEVVTATNKVNMPGALEVTGTSTLGVTNVTSTLGVTGATTLTGGIAGATLSVTPATTFAGALTVNNTVTVAGSSNGSLLVYRPLSTVGAFSSMKYDAQQANGTRVTYGEEGFTIIANTNSAYSSAKDWYTVNAGTGALNMRIWNDGNVTIRNGGSYVNNGFRLEVIGTSRVTGNSYFGGTGSTTAKVHIAAGTATANTAPLKLTSGTNLTTPEAGAFEYNGTSLFFSPGASRLRAVLSDNTIPSAGQLAIGDGTNYTVGSLVGGTGIDVSYTGNLTVRKTNAESATQSGAGTLTLSTASNYIFTGTTTTWTLPSAASGANISYFIKNRGSGDITLVTTGAANEIYTTAATNSVTITPGGWAIVKSDGNFWNYAD